MAMFAFLESAVDETTREERSDVARGLGEARRAKATPGERKAVGKKLAAARKAAKKKGGK